MGGFSLGGEETYQHLGKFGDRWLLVSYKRWWLTNSWNMIHQPWESVRICGRGSLRYSNFGRQSCGWFNHQFYLIIVSAVFWLLSAKWRSKNFQESMNFEKRSKALPQRGKHQRLAVGCSWLLWGCWDQRGFCPQKNTPRWFRPRSPQGDHPTFQKQTVFGIWNHQELSNLTPFSPQFAILFSRKKRALPWSLPPSPPETPGFPEVPGLWEDITDGFGHRTYDKLNETDLVAPTRPRRYDRRFGATFMLWWKWWRSPSTHWSPHGQHLDRSQTLGENITGITTKAPPRRLRVGPIHLLSVVQHLHRDASLFLHIALSDTAMDNGEDVSGQRGRCGYPLVN